MAKDTVQPKSDEAVIVDAAGNPVPEVLPGGLTSGGQFSSPFKVVNPPLDKRLWCITDREVRLGSAHGWAIYTPEMLAEDSRSYGTVIPSQPVLSNGRVEVASHFYVFVPMQVAERMDAAKRMRMTEGEKSQGEVKVENRHEGKVNITTKFVKSHDGLPG